MKNFRFLVGHVVFILNLLISSCTKDEKKQDYYDKCTDDQDKKWQSIDEVKELCSKLNVEYSQKILFGENCEDLKNLEVDEQEFVNYSLSKKEIEKFKNCIRNEYRPLVYIKFINKTVGYGVFAGENFKKGDYLFQYTGVVKKTVSDGKYAWNYPLNTSSLKNNKSIKREIGSYILDAANYGNEGRFVNDPLDSNLENIVVESLYFDNQFHILYIAKKDINKNEQLFVSYGANYWKNRKGEKLK